MSFYLCTYCHADTVLCKRLQEAGADAVLVNTAIVVAGDPLSMAIAFKLAVEAGRMAYEAKLGKIQKQAAASSPLTAFLSEG